MTSDTTNHEKKVVWRIGYPSEECDIHGDYIGAVLYSDGTWEKVCLLCEINKAMRL